MRLETRAAKPHRAAPTRPPKPARTLLFLHPSAELYGADRTLLQLVEGLDRTRWRAVCALPRRGPLAELLEAAGAKVEIGQLGIAARASLKLGGVFALALNVPRGILFVRALVHKYQPAVVHTNTLIVLGGALGAWSTRVPHLWHLHEIFVRPKWLKRRLAGLVQRLSQRVIANSQATADCFEQAIPALADKLRVIHNGVKNSVPPERREQQSARRELGLNPNGPLIVLVGRINAWKGQGLLVESAARLRAAHPEARFLIVGDAPPGQAHFVEKLQQQVLDHGVGQRVAQRDFVADSSKLYAAADIVCVPSLLPEPFGMVAVEAMASARPVVASDHGGLSEIVEHEHTGLLFEPGDVEALTLALGRLLANPGEAARFGASGLERQRSAFTLKRYRAEFAQEYEELAARAPVRAPVRSPVRAKRSPTR